MDSSNLRIEPFSGEEAFRELSGESFAAAIGMPEEHIRWVPAMEPGNASRMWLQEFSLSFDYSVLLLSERTGEKDGPFGTRILLFSTNNLVALRVIELPYIAREIRCEGCSGRLWFLREPQPDTLRDSAALCILDVKEGKLIQEIPLKSVPDRMVPHITGKFAWIYEKGVLSRVYSDGNIQKVLQVKDGKDLSFSPDCEYFTVMTKTGFEVYSSGTVRRINKTDFVSGNTFLYLNGDPPGFLVGKSKSGIPGLFWLETLYIVTEGKIRIFSDDLSGSIVPDFSGKSFFAVKPNGRIERLNAVTGKTVGYCIHRSLKPAYPGNILHLFPLNEPDRFLIFDTAGGLSKVDASTKRWHRVQSMRPWTE